MAARPEKLPRTGVDRHRLVIGAALLALAPLGCAKATGGDPLLVDGGGFVVKKPPSLGVGQTSSDCMGVTDRGRCEVTGGGEAAVVCDTSRNLLRRIDCTVMGRHCVMDTQRGATCVDVPVPDGGVPIRDGGSGAHDGGATVADAGMPMCPTGVTYAGFCTTSNQAVWCDPSTGSTVLWDCNTQPNMACAENSCTQGAYCCPTGSPMPTPSPTPSPSTDSCGGLTFAGVCSGEHARYCSGGSVVDIDCTTRGQTCQVDTCTSGAYCCSASSADMGIAADLSPSDSCGGLDYAGVCDGNTVRYCSGGEIRTIDCATQSKTCQVNVCGTGAYCCQ